MTNYSYSIAFTYPLDEGKSTVHLTADVEVLTSNIYVVKNFSIAGSASPSILPAIELKKMDGCWVHRDSMKDSVLSRCIGEILDRQIGKAKKQ